jgi:PAS domain S-box-containing protein
VLSRASISGAASQRPSSEVRLAFLEALLGAEDLQSCARTTVDWLARYCGASQSILLAIRSQPGPLEVAASVGVPHAALEDFSLDLVEDRDHPLVRALTQDRPASFPAARAPRTPLKGAVHAIPVGGRRGKNERHAVALLLLGGSLSVAPEVQWAVEVVGERLVRLHEDAAAAEQRYSRERALLYSIINAVTDPILLTDTEGRLLIANARAERLFSAREDESEGRRQAVRLNNMLFSAALSSRSMEHAESTRNELLLVDPSEGADLLFEFLASPVREPDGQTGVVSVLRNVTDLGRATQEVGESYKKLHLAQQEVRSERHRLDLVLDSVADPIVVTDAAGDIVIMNPPAERLFSLPLDGDEEVQRRVRANDAHFSSFVTNLFLTGNEVRRGEFNLVDPVDGSARPVEAVAGKVLSEQGEVTTVVTILHDRREALEKAELNAKLQRAKDELQAKVQAATAELAEQNELLRRQAIELEQASAAKSQFLANMSHELRTPLNAMLGYCNMLVQGVNGEMTPSQKRSLLRIDSNGRHLLEVINEILDITRIEAGRMPLHVSEFRLPELINEVLSELEPIIQRTKLPVTADLPPKLPGLVTDRQKVKQIVLNLLSNALKFTHEGSIEITVRYDAKAREVTITVKDTGIGIAPQHREKVFEDFQQVDSSTTRPYGGTGLGLSICRRLATMLDGRITLQSELGQGSTFTLYLPRRIKHR